MVAVRAERSGGSGQRLGRQHFGRIEVEVRAVAARGARLMRRRRLGRRRLGRPRSGVAPARRAAQPAQRAHGSMGVAWRTAAVPSSPSASSSLWLRRRRAQLRSRSATRARFSGESASSQAAAARAFGAIQDGRVSAPSVGVGRLRAQAWPPRAGRRRRRHPRCLSDSSRESRSNGTVLSTLLLASNYPPNYRGARRGRKHVTNGWMDTPPDILK